MCVIVLKPKGINIPDIKTLQACFDYNPHGAGVAYVREDENCVHIRKGFMHFKHLKRAIESLNFTLNDTVMYHFRIATAGKICKENTHPFPLSKNLNDLHMLSVKTNCAIAHNGILDMKPETDKKSDTMLFIMNVLSDPVIYHNLKNKAIISLIEGAIGHGKIALLHADGTFTLYNESLWITESGILYSNDFWKYPVNLIYDWDTGYYGTYADYPMNLKLPGTKRKETVECPWCKSNEIQQIDKLEDVISYWCFNCNTEFQLN